jgi:hypothetical protein
MPISQAEMAAPERSAVLAFLDERLTTNRPIVGGRIRKGQSGSPWVSFGGSKAWFRWQDAGEDGEAGRCVVDGDEIPLGSPVEGPMMLSTISDKRGVRPVVFAVNTGMNYEHEIIWEDE